MNYCVLVSLMRELNYLKPQGPKVLLESKLTVSTQSLKLDSPIMMVETIIEFLDTRIDNHDVRVEVQELRNEEYS